jgi:hypothetical protein
MTSAPTRYATFADLPPELLAAVAAAVFAAALPPAAPSLDPLLAADAPTQCWPEPLARRTLRAFCSANRACLGAARPWLWRALGVRLPRDWLALLAQTVEAGDGAPGVPDGFLEPAPGTAMGALCDADAPGMSVPPELLSPPASRDPSPRRLRGKSQSPPRWKVLRSLADAMEDLMRGADPALSRKSQVPRVLCR